MLAKINPEHSPLYHLRNNLENYLEMVDELIISNIDNNEILIKNITHHIISAGGKRLRPLMCLAASSVAKEISKNSIYLAGAIELIHIATLLHDDVIDESKLRRGAPTANSNWDNKSSILVGDFLFAKAFETMVKTNNIRFLNILSSASAKISEGEVKQLRIMNSFNTSIDDYLEVIQNKTAVLFESACKTGSLAACDSEATADSLGRYGLNFGIMYQIMDDIYDYTSNNRGKEIGDDFKEGKVTLPLIIAFKADPDKNFWHNLFSKNKDDEKNFLETQERLKHFKGIEKSLEIADLYRTKAEKEIKIFDNKFGNLLLDLLQQFI